MKIWKIAVLLVGAAAIVYTGWSLAVDRYTPEVKFRGTEVSVLRLTRGFWPWNLEHEQYSVSFLAGDKMYAQFPNFQRFYPPYEVLWRAGCSCIVKIRDYRGEWRIEFERDKSGAGRISAHAGEAFHVYREIPYNDPEAQKIIKDAEQAIADAEKRFAPIITEYQAKYESEHPNSN